VDGTERPLQLKSTQEVLTTENVEIEPRLLYSMVPVPIAIANPAAFPFNRYPRVEVHCEYADTANSIRDQEILFLDKDNTSKTWNVFVRQQGPLQFKYKLIYRAADNRDFETEPRTTDAREVMVRDPFPTKRSVLIVPPANFGVLDQVFVDLLYEDKKNQYRQEESYNFSQTDHPNKTFSIDLRDPSQRRVAFDVIFLDKNGNLFQVPRSYTLENRIIIRSDMRGHRIISIRSSNVDFAQKKLRELNVQLRYVDTDNSLQFLGQSTFKSSTDEATFEFDYVDPAKSGYEYKISALFQNGMTQDFDFKSSTADDLILGL
jgi:hypothetical protein